MDSSASFVSGWLWDFSQFKAVPYPSVLCGQLNERWIFEGNFASASIFKGIEFHKTQSSNHSFMNFVKRAHFCCMDPPPVFFHSIQLFKFASFYRKSHLTITKEEKSAQSINCQFSSTNIKFLIPWILQEKRFLNAFSASFWNEEVF